MGKRYSAITTEDTTLSFQLYRSGVAVDAFLVVKVEVFATNEDATLSQNVISTIYTEDIVRKDIGLYEYIVPQQSAGKYFDKATVVPMEGNSAVEFINSYDVYEISGAVSNDVPLCVISGCFLSADGVPYPNLEVGFTVDDVDSPSVLSIDPSKCIVPNALQLYTDELGAISCALIRGVTYRLHIRKLGVNTKILIPNSDSCNLWALTQFKTIGVIPIVVPEEPETPTTPDGETPTVPEDPPPTTPPEDTGDNW